MPTARISSSTNGVSGDRRSKAPLNFNRPAFSAAHAAASLTRCGWMPFSAITAFSTSRSCSISAPISAKNAPSGVPSYCATARPMSSIAVVEPARWSFR